MFDAEVRPDAENLAAFLYRVRDTDPDSYRRIRDVVRLGVPFFDDFQLRPLPMNSNLIQLEWRQKDSDYPFPVNQLSEGTLRFIRVATTLPQPLRATAVYRMKHPHHTASLTASSIVIRASKDV